IQALHPGWASEPAPPLPRATVRAAGRGRRGIREAAWRLGWTWLRRRRTPPGELASGLADPVGELAQRRRDEGVGDAQNDRVDEGDAPLAPMFAILEKLLLALRVYGPAGGDQGLVVGIEQHDGNKFARFDQLIGAALDQFVQDRHEAFRWDHPAPGEPHPADGRAEGVGENLRAVAQVGLSGLLDPLVLL